MTLGPRVIKTGISVTLALYICSLLSLEPAVFAGVAAIVTIQPSVYRTWQQVIDQLKTNTLGALIALAAVYYFGSNPFSIGVVLIVVILISLKLKMERTISLSLVTVLAIMSAPGDGDLGIYTFNRFLIILIGMTSAFLVNILIYPPTHRNNYLDQSRVVFDNMSLLIRTSISNEMKEKLFQEQLVKLERDMDKLKEQFKMFDEEREKLAKLKPVDQREIIVFKQMLKSLQLGADVLKIIDEHYFQSKSSELENQLFDAHLEYLIKCHEHFLLKYDGKIKVDEHRLDNVTTESRAFLEKVMDTSKSGSDKLRLVIVGSTIYEYAFQLERLNQLIEHFLKKK
ncbi:FUSC family protein [Bacillus sp. Marseille-P3661]|uniref:FUSC family protein n=1 Tax=Bacillus sp. Marseille-P3661 TaxID=1936234 RepID=UPI000C84581E|nr:aromatic acid exporter family protein [Bacillus sp. Marseille-P3661]